MKTRLLLATLLVAGSTLVGCGGSPAVTDVEPPAGPLSASDVAEAQAEMDRASDAERALQQSEAPVGSNSDRRG